MMTTTRTLDRPASVRISLISLTAHSQKSLTDLTLLNSFSLFSFVNLRVFVLVLIVIVPKSINLVVRPDYCSWLQAFRVVVAC